jgi:CRISPR/Cas system CSM-associated protein Csm2 small subunit
MTSWFKDKYNLSKSENIDELADTINEQSAEQRKLLGVFDTAMSNFAAERSLETCLDALNASMQIANIRGRLVECYEHYARLLEEEVKRISRREGDNGKS